MSGNRPNPKEAGRYFALAQVGMEMVAPIVLGLLLDHYLGWSPWATIVGAVLGLVGGMSHLIILLDHQETKDSSSSKQDQQ